MISTDTYFGIGKTHEVCQDYARCGVAPDGKAYALVSDGCSSSPDTDFGSRLLTMAAVHQRNLFPEAPLDPHWAIWRAFSMVQSPLTPACLDATLLGITETQDGVRVSIAGDGVVCARNRATGLMRIWDFDFRGAPGYPSYLLDARRLVNYRREGFGDRIVRICQEEKSGDFIQEEGEEGLFGPSGGDSNEDGFDGVAARLTFSSFEWDLVMIASDGVHSFQRNDNLQSVPMLDVLWNLMAIKSFTGQFVSRRCRAFEKFCIKEGWHHNDDLGVAAAYMLDTPGAQD